MPQPDVATGLAIRGRAFGIGIESTFRIPCIPEFATNGSQPTHVELLSAAELDGSWRPRGAELIIDRRLGDKRLMTIEHDADRGYRIWASRFGRHIVSNDGLNVSSALPPVTPSRWQRLLFAQVLPLAAALRGLDPFHASAVAVDGRALAFVAASGSGKTSVAGHLVAQGASFMTDDVLSLAFAGTELLAHPGPAMTSISPQEVRAMPKEQRARLGPSVGREIGKNHFKPLVVAEPQRLAAMFFLQRHTSAARLSVEAIRNPDPRLLLSSSFITYVRRPEHLVTHLETCARIAETVPMFELQIPENTTARATADLVAQQFAEIR